MVQGDKLELKCEVTGYPVPTVTWHKDGVLLNNTERISFQAYKDTASGQLRIFDLSNDDDGNYTCVAENTVPPYNASASMKLRVKGKQWVLHMYTVIFVFVFIICVFWKFLH